MLRERRLDPPLLVRQIGQLAGGVFEAALPVKAVGAQADRVALFGVSDEEQPELERLPIARGLLA